MIRVDAGDPTCPRSSTLDGEPTPSELVDAGAYVLGSGELPAAMVLHAEDLSRLARRFEIVLGASPVPRPDRRSETRAALAFLGVRLYPDPRRAGTPGAHRPGHATALTAAQELEWLGGPSRPSKPGRDL